MTSLRDLTLKDLDSLVRWRVDPNVNCYLADRLKSRDEADVWFNGLKSNPQI